MPVYCVCYDLDKPGQNYEGLIEEIKASAGWQYVMRSTWLIHTNEDVYQLAQRLTGRIDSNDPLLVTRVEREFAGRLPDEVGAWLNASL